MDGEISLPLAKKRKVAVTHDGREDEEVAGPSSRAPLVNQSQLQLATVAVFRSPNTTPMLPAETWRNILGYLSPDDLKTALNTCPEWNELLAKEKTTILFPNVLEIIKMSLHYKDALRIRLVSKTWKAAAESAFPQIPDEIEARATLEAVRQELLAKIRLGMRWEARAALRRVLGLPEEVYNPNEDEQQVVPQNRYAPQQMHGYIRQGLQNFADQRQIGGPLP